MKKLLTVILLTAVTTQAGAQEDKDWRETCKNLSGFAETVMTKHQQGVSIVDAMAIVEGKEFFEKMILAAYESPRYNGEAMQQREIDDFRDKTYLECAKAMTSD